MLSKETRSSIGQLFKSIIDNETIIEPLRYQLNTKDDFDPFLLFKRLDPQNQKEITLDHIFKFLKLHKINGNLNEIRFLIMIYDCNSNNSINYNQFLNMVLCQKYYCLKKQQSEFKHYLSFETEKLFVMLLQAEMTLARNIIALLPQITKKEDFSVKGMINDLKANNYLLKENFEEMVRQKWMNEDKAGEGELFSLMKRLDLTKNGKVTIEELEKVIYFPYTTPPMIMKNHHNQARMLDSIQKKRDLSLDMNKITPRTTNHKPTINTNLDNNVRDKYKGKIDTNTFVYSNANTNVNTMANINSNCNKTQEQQQEHPKKEKIIQDQQQELYNSNQESIQSKPANILTKQNKISTPNNTSNNNNTHNNSKDHLNAQANYCPTESYCLKSFKCIPLQINTQPDEIASIKSSDSHRSIKYHRQLRSPDQERIKEREMTKYKPIKTEPIPHPIQIKDSINIYQKHRDNKVQAQKGNQHNNRYQYQYQTTEQNIDRINQRLATSPLQGNQAYHQTRYISTIHNYTDMNRNECLNDRLETIEMNPTQQIIQTCQPYMNNITVENNIHKAAQMPIPTLLPDQMQRTMTSPAQMPLRISDTLNIRLSPERQTYNNDEYYNYYQYNITNTAPNNYYPSPKNNNIQSQFTLQDDLIAIWKQISYNEKSIEDIKIQLASQPDFNIEDAFRIFETNQSNSQLSFSDIKIGYAAFNLFPSTLQLQLLINRYDITKKGHINYADFFDMLTPFKKTIRNDIEHRQPNKYRPSFNKTNIFNGITKNYLKQLLSILVNTESHLDSLRKGINLTNEDAIHDLFTKIDMKNKGYLTPDDVKRYMKDNRISFDQNDVDLLYIRLDKNRDGKIQYEEVVTEFFSLQNSI